MIYDVWKEELSSTLTFLNIPTAEVECWIIDDPLLLDINDVCECVRVPVGVGGGV